MAGSGGPAGTRAPLRVNLAGPAGTLSFGKPVALSLTVRNDSDRALLVLAVEPGGDPGNEPARLSGPAYGALVKETGRDAWVYNSLAQTATHLPFFQGLLLPGQKLTTPLLARPLSPVLPVRVLYVPAAAPYDGSPASLAPFKVYLPAPDGQPGGMDTLYTPFTGELGRKPGGEPGVLAPPGPASGGRGVLIPDLAAQPDSFELRLDLRVEASPFPPEAARAAVNRITGGAEPLPEPAYSLALNGFVIGEGEKSWVLTRPDQPDRGPLLPAVPPALLMDVDARGGVLIQVGQRQEGFGPEPRDAGWKFRDTWPVRYGDGMYTCGEFIRVEPADLRSFLEQSAGKGTALSRQEYFFHECYYVLQVPPDAAGKAGPDPGNLQALPVAEREDPAVGKAIEALRMGPPPDGQPWEESKKRLEELDRAWEELKKAGPRAIPALKAELGKTTPGSGAGDYFRVEAAALLYEIGGPSELPAALEALAGTDPAANVGTLFRVCHRAAMDRAPRSLELLHILLQAAAAGGSTVLPMHSLRLDGEAMLVFTYGVYGPGACDELLRAAETDPDPEARRLAAAMLIFFRHQPVLPILRRWVQGTEEEARVFGLRGLGTMAHPDDRALLESLAGHPDGKVRFACAWAFYEYGDPATAPVLRSLLKDPEPEVRREAAAAASHLIDVESGLALAAMLKSEPEEPIRDKIREWLAEMAESAGGKAADLEAGREAAWRNAVTAYWNMRDHFFDLRKDDRRLSRDEMMKALRSWREAHSINGGEYEWVDNRHVLSVAVPADLPLLFDVRSSVLWRLSDEGLEDARVLDRLIAVLYRRGIGAAKPNE